MDLKFDVEMKLCSFNSFLTLFHQRGEGCGRSGGDTRQRRVSHSVNGFRMKSMSKTIQILILKYRYTYRQLRLH